MNHIMQLKIHLYKIKWNLHKHCSESRAANRSCQRCGFCLSTELRRQQWRIPLFRIGIPAFTEKLKQIRHSKVVHLSPGQLIY